MSEDKLVKGYKVFNPDWTCKGFQYKVGESYEMDEEPISCITGYHFCKKLVNCFDYYDFDSKNKVAEVTAYGDIEEELDKCCTNKIRIEKELSWDEVLDIVNIGIGCTGYVNTGNDNTGDYNTGDFNTGSCNTGNHNDGNDNTGDYNSGTKNTGNHNTGSFNAGDYNTGTKNTGDYNSGSYNTGDYNSGSYNTGENNIGSYNTNFGNMGHKNTGEYNEGNYNVGDNNTGDCNIGNYNVGSCNTGDTNTGNFNVGNHNAGSFNIGDWNSASYSNGCFNTVEQKMYFFNKISDWRLKDWIGSEAKSILDKISVNPTQRIYVDDMTNEEKEKYPEYKTIGFYSKKLISEEIEEKQQKNWNELTQEEKDIVMAIPNFDKEIFKQIIGIDVNMEG